SQEMKDRNQSSCKLLSLYMLLTFNCSFITKYHLAAGSLSWATVLLAWRSLEEACGCLVSLGRSVTASASRGVPKAIHFLNSGRKQRSRVGAAGQRGSQEEMRSPINVGIFQRGLCWEITAVMQNMEYFCMKSK
uniref:Uncharacterized protein n=1 Tax=Bubo bubo TaxID=30461 RepID=A0A8C0ELQ2_BUBBB